MSAVAASWVLALLSAFAIASGVMARSHVRLADRHGEDLAAYSHATGGLVLVQSALETIDDDSCALLQTRALALTFSPTELVSGGFMVTGSPFLDADTMAQPGIVDEAAKLPVALADSKALVALGIAPDQAARLAREFDRGRRSVACEDTTTARLLSSLVTPFPTGGVNLNTAPAPVLRAMGLPEGAVLKLVTQRNGPDGMVSTPDDRPFTSLTDPEGGLRAAGLSSEGAAAVAFLADTELLRVYSRYYRARVWGWNESEQVVCQLEAVYRLDDDAVAELEMRRSWIRR